MSRTNADKSARAAPRVPPPTVRPAFQSVIRELARCYQAFEAFSAAKVRGFGLTQAQFDVIATLGNTPGMSFRELGEKTLITKGTLTGVVDRLQAKRLVRRLANPLDSRSQIVQLTAAGERLFARAFPEMLAHVSARFAGFTPGDLERMRRALEDLKHAFQRGSGKLRA
jgi:DNA-binding MarR family transcriptional regulator